MLEKMMNRLPSYLMFDGQKYRMSLDKFDLGENMLGTWRIWYYKHVYDEAGNVAGQHNVDMCVDENPSAETVNGENLEDVINLTLEIIKKYELDAGN